MARALASSIECWEEKRDGIATPHTDSDPTASTATAAVNAESMPPDKPMIAGFDVELISETVGKDSIGMPIVYGREN